MKKFYSTVLFIFFSIYISFSQIDCGSARYYQDVFEDIEVIRNVKYGENTNWIGGREELFMDVFMPKNDSETFRPLIILAHGGFFLTGDKQQEDVVPIARALAKKGYVTVSIDYRKGFNILTVDSVAVAEAVVRGYHDGKACVRFFRKNVSEDGNTYGINSDLIFVGGNSAGGFLGLHLAFVDDVNKLPNFIDTTRSGLQGGAEGLSGNPGFSSEVMGVISIAGAIGDVSWIDNPNIAVLSMHGDADATVPFARGYVNFATRPLIAVDGSKIIHEKLDDINAYNCFKPFYGRGHTPHTSGPDMSTNMVYLDSTIAQISNFLLGRLCGVPLKGCENVEYVEEPAYIAKINTSELPYGIVGNPSHQMLRINFKKALDFTLFDITGKLVGQELQSIGYKEISLKSGIYILRIQDGAESFSEKVIVY